MTDDSNAITQNDLRKFVTGVILKIIDKRLSENKNTEIYPATIISTDSTNHYANIKITTGGQVSILNNVKNKSVNILNNGDKVFAVAPNGDLNNLYVGTNLIGNGINGQDIVANSIQANSIQANSITADEIQAGSITANEIASNTITADNIKAGSITANEIATGTITASSGIIATGAIQTAQIADGSVTDAKILTLTANKLTAGTIDAGKINVINLDCANLTVGTINGQQISSGAITIDKLESSISTAIEGAQGKSKNFYGSDTPKNPSKGDLWMKPIDGGIKPQQWDGSQWIDMTDITAIKAQEELNNLSIGVNNLIRNGDFSENVKSGTIAPTYWEFWTTQSGSNPEVFGSQGQTNYNLPNTLYIGHATVQSGIHQNVMLKQNTEYTIMFSSRKEGVNDVFNQFEFYDSSWNKLSTMQVDYDYTKPDTLQSFTITTPITFVYSQFSHGGIAQVWQSGYLTTLGNVTLVEGNKVPSGWVPSLADLEDASFLRTGTISADRIGANSITADKLVAGSITSASGVIGALDAGSITTGVLSADRIGTESITSDRLYCNGNLNNVALNANVNINGGVQNSGGMCSQNPNGMGGWSTSTFPSTAIVDLGDIVPQIREITFDTYYPTDTRWVPHSYIIEGSTDNTSWTTIADVSNYTPSGNNTFIRHALSGTYRYISIKIREPQPNQGSVTITSFKVMSMQGGTIIDGNMIKTGSILADKIHANTITGDKLVEDAITAREIASNTITAESGIIASLDAGKITTGVLSADRIDTNNLNARRITTPGSILHGTIGSWQEATQNINGFQLYNTQENRSVFRIADMNMTWAGDLLRYSVLQGNADGLILTPSNTTYNSNNSAEGFLDAAGQFIYLGGGTITLASGGQGGNSVNVSSSAIDIICNNTSANKGIGVSATAIEFEVGFDDGGKSWNYHLIRNTIDNGTSQDYYILSSRNVMDFIMNEDSNGLGVHCNNGTTYWAYNFNASDERLKTNIKPITTNCSSIINQINLKEFDFIKTGEHIEVGTIAQQLSKINKKFSKILYTTEDGTNFFAPDYNSILPYIIGAIQELSAKSKSLETRVTTLENSIQELKASK
ncbi:hypothetical protein BJV85_002884 [Clostridium acetobutylicum]|uniref:tail fiber domain-containing protein n=1 Tax=Clostridium acetobutylicum TaxID=1488 RepID=UPI000200A732|nr:tail fiber domain-containing protein [Clostridium acetobutylicum]ADZ20163.1 hypothetical protein CEA_G1125 [Clostridium acetobutylicum EA 2018]AEI31625.1 hypothetical protein SMB_G1132 [Clostridium acetobutylicum DSM 1731]MBC2393305.1 hypothetical protein [Clostridium acetobutylicum]MBC2585851.1 hypothetical protein [Clostridium acetobutylicum]NOV89935.1 hypothetical protein [Clostridium acetobutylicum]